MTNTFAQEVFDYLEEYDGPLVNDQGVEIIILYENPDNPFRKRGTDLSIFMAIEIPGVPRYDEHTSVSYMHESKSVADFTETFHLDTTEDIHKISAGVLQNLYNKGIAEIACNIDGIYCYSLYFRKKKDGMIVKNDDDQEFELPQPLQTPQEIMEYTNWQHELSKMREAKN